MTDENTLLDLWPSRFEDFSYNNGPFGLANMHLLVGQLLKYQRIKKKGQVLDGRCNVFGMMDTGSGKSVALDMIAGYSEKLDINVCTIASTTDAALLGTVETETEYNEYNDKETKYVTTEGVLQDADIIHFDEGEILLNPDKNNMNMKLFFQIGMNPIGTPSNIIRKKLAHGEWMEIPVEGSFYFTSYVPTRFESMVVNSGLLPRMLMVPKELSYADRMTNSMIDIDNLGEDDLDHEWMDKEIISILKQIQTDGQKQLEFDYSRVKPTIKNTVASMYDIFEQSSYLTQKIMYGFVPRYQNILYILAMHHAVINDRMNIRVDDVRYAYKGLIEPALKNMLTLVEISTTQSQKGAAEERMVASLALQEYEKMKSMDNGGWVGIKRLSRSLGSAMHKSENTGRRYIKILIEKNVFEEMQSGNTTLLRPAPAEAY